MNELAIRAEGLSKRYRIRGPQAAYGTLRDTLASAARGLFRRRPARVRDSEFYALRDLSFEVRRGEAVGVIGRNGAGKSTLLKVLCRITEPTAGHALVRGRVGALLEVGTGFHPELSGRENTYLSGAILGMPRDEIHRKFDEIVEFAGVAKFIDTPVKHYSSGMYLRLAFSVAAHLEPEVLIVDEVLAVGDAAFQKKCLGKMEDVASHGRTVLFVSHNLGTIKELCQTALVLNEGVMTFRGPVAEGIAHYTESVRETVPEQLSHGIAWAGVRVNRGLAGELTTLERSQPVQVTSRLDVAEDFDFASLFVTIDDALGKLLVHQRIDTTELPCTQHLPAGTYRIGVDLPALWLAPGVYRLYMKFSGRTTHGTQCKRWSEPALLDVTGSVAGIHSAALAPDVQWSVIASADAAMERDSAPVGQLEAVS